MVISFHISTILHQNYTDYVSWRATWYFGITMYSYGHVTWLARKRGSHDNIIIFEHDMFKTFATPKYTSFSFLFTCAKGCIMSCHQVQFCKYSSCWYRCHHSSSLGPLNCRHLHPIYSEFRDGNWVIPLFHSVELTMPWNTLSAPWKLVEVWLE